MCGTDLRQGRDGALELAAVHDPGNEVGCVRWLASVDPPIEDAVVTHAQTEPGRRLPAERLDVKAGLLARERVQSLPNAIELFSRPDPAQILLSATRERDAPQRSGSLRGVELVEYR